MPKKIIITEQLYNYILENEQRQHILSEMVKEELSINNRILSFTNELGNKITKNLNTTEKTNVYDGVTSEKFTLGHIELDDYEITVAVTNVDFRDRKTFDELYQKYKNYIEYSYTSPLMERKQLFIYLHSCSISGGLVKSITLDNLQHELEHCYQMILNNEVLPKDKNYSVTFNTINSGLDEKELEYIISEALYYSYSFEQDGYVNGLYQYMVNSETPMVDLKDIANSPACDAYFKLKRYIGIIEKADKDDVSKILKNKFGLGYNRYIELLHKASRRFIKKIGNILALHRMRAVENGVRLNENIGGALISV